MRVAHVLPIAALIALGGAALTLSSCGPDNANNTVAVSPTAVPTTAPPAGKQWVDVVAKTEDGGFLMGNPAAPIKLVEYGSRSCPHCKRFSEESGPLRDKYVASGQVSYEFRDFLIHPQDGAASLLGQCVPAEAYFTILDGMFAAQDASYKRLEALPGNYQQILAGMTPQQAAAWWADQAGYREFMMQHGVPSAKVDTCLNDKAVLGSLSKLNEKATGELGVNGTPTFFINGNKTDASDWAMLEPLLRNAGAR
jgi:protein-disulfide isomerase